MSSKKINILSKQFWQWFANEMVRLNNNYTDKVFINELDSRITALGEMDWEIGPGIKLKNNNMLILSPHGDKGLLKITKEIILAAPILKGWEFYYCRPAKEWDRTFSLYIDEQEFKIDSSNWHYVFLQYEDNTCDIIIETNNLRFTDDDYAIQAAEILIDGEIGEENRIKMFSNIEVVPEFDNELKEKSTHIQYLMEHFKSILI